MDDRVLRAVTFDGSFRVITAETTSLVQEAIHIHREQVSADMKDAKAFAELLTASIILRETMAPGHRFQAALTHHGLGQIVADSRPSFSKEPAAVKGLLSKKVLDGKAVLSEDASLRVTRSLPHGKVHQSIVQAEADNISEAFMNYLQNSEQIIAMFDVVTVIEDGEVLFSGGYLVQLLPECDKRPLAIMTERLAHDFRMLSSFFEKHGSDPQNLMNELLYGFKHEILAEEALSYSCDCSEERVLGALTTLGREELEDIVSTGDAVTLTCEYCRTPWTIGTHRLEALLTSN